MSDALIVERVARAICYSMSDYASEPHRQYLTDKYWQEHIPEARASILAMREPSPAMLDAANKSDRKYTDRVFGTRQIVMQGPHDHWVAMIDEALREQP